MKEMTKVFFLFLFFSLGMVSFSFAASQNANNAKVLTHKIKKGDMLRKISLKYFGTEKKAIFLAQINGIKNPDKIRAGVIMKLSNSAKNVGYKKYKKNLRRNFAPVSGVKKLKIEQEKALVINYDVDDSKIVETKKQNVTAEIAANVEIFPTVDEEKSDLSEVAAAEKEKQEIAIAQRENTSALDVMVDRLYQEVKKPIIEPSLEFTADDIMPNVSEFEEAESKRSTAILKGIEHQLSLNVISSKNKIDDMTGGMLDYVGWSNIPMLGENFSLGAGVFASAWEDEISNARIGAITPGVQLGLKYINHSEDHLVRMIHGKVMVGKTFRNVGQKSSPALFSDGDPMLKTISMESEDVMSTGELMDLNVEIEDMNQMKPIKSENYYRLGSMLGAQYQLNQRSTLELMNENWFSLGDKTAMEMDPTFSLIGSHVYTTGNWSLKLGLGPQYEDWSKTWRLHVAAAEITYKEFASLGFFSDMYPWKKGAMYSGLRSRDLNSLGAVLSFNFGKSIHKGHEISSK